jgi:hypothetical protein
VKAVAAIALAVSLAVPARAQTPAPAASSSDVKPFARGVNSIQLFHDQDHWWILSVLWDEETATNPLPANLATRPNAAAPKSRLGVRPLF